MKNVVIIFWNISLHQVFWLKDNVEINTKDGYYIVSNTGDLLISQTKLRDMGNYTCGAKNLAARRLSESASLIVYGKVSTPTTPVKKMTPPPPSTHTHTNKGRKKSDRFWRFCINFNLKSCSLTTHNFLKLALMKDIPMTLTKILFDHERDIYIFDLFFILFI